MKCRLAALALLSLLPVMPLRADEPHLEFVRGLRANGKADLALQYLQSKSTKLSPGQAILLPLELAKTRLELAALQADAASRAALQEQARLELERFLKDNPKHPLAAEAALEMARIARLRGKALLSQARREEAKEAERTEILQARSQFEQAGKQLHDAKVRIDEQLKASGAPETSQAEGERDALLQAQLQAELELGINLLDQAQTYTEVSELPGRAALLKKARDDVLEKLAQREPKTAITWQALAWLGRCHFEDDDPRKARRVYMDVINAEAGLQADAGRRLARSFRLQALAKETDQKKALAEIVSAGEEWLRLYPHYVHTPEGYEVRFQLANAYLKQARALPKSSSQAREKYEAARKHFQILEQTDSDYATAARDNRLNIVLVTSLDRTKGDINKLRDFEECYLRAEFERATIAQARKEPRGEKHDQQRKLHFKNMVDALERGLDLADAKSASEDVNQARLLLAYAYLTRGDYYRAAVVGEDLARSEPRFAQAPMAGAYALSAYGQLVAQREKAGAAPEDLAVERNRERRLALYLEQTWPTSQAADIARSTLGRLLIGDKDYRQAVEVLERISPSYPDATRALYQLSVAALQAQKNDLQPPPGKPAYEERARAALERIPDLAPSADDATARDYFAAKLTLADIYYRNHQHDKLEALAQALAKNLGSTEQTLQEAFQTSVFSVLLYAKLGKGEAAYKAGRYRDAREAVVPAVRQLMDSSKNAQLADLKEKNPLLLRAVLGLALRATVQDNHVDEGKQVLDFLQRTFPENALEILVQLVQQLRSHLQALRQQGPSAEAQRKTLVTNFAAFLDELAKRQHDNAKPETTLFLAQSYSSLDKHERAAALLRTMKEDAPPGLYHLARILLVRELRLSKDFVKAEATLKEVLATDWGKQNLEAKKESILLLEDQEKYQLSRSQGAIPEWNQLMLSLRPKLQDNRIKEQYFDCYYHLTYCIFKNALKKTDPKARQKDIHVAATFIARLMEQPDTGVEPCKKHFEELLEKEPLLKNEYDALTTNASNNRK